MRLTASDGVQRRTKHACAHTQTLLDRYRHADTQAFADELRQTKKLMCVCVYVCGAAVNVQRGRGCVRDRERVRGSEKEK